MKVENFTSLAGMIPGDERREELKREKTATDFEELFARFLVREMTKGVFEENETSGTPGHSNALYREFITEALSGELAARRKLGMAEMVKIHWDRNSDL